MTEADIFGGCAWHVVVARPTEVARAVVNLERQGFRAYAPMAVEADGETSRRLFERYVFVGAVDGMSSSALRGTYGVAEVVADALGAPKRLTAQDVAALRRIRAREMSDGGAVALNPQVVRPVYRRGEALTVADGPFAGLAGIFQRSVAGGKVARLLLDLFGREVEADVPMPLVERRQSGKDFGVMLWNP